jgi:hypothetical protein
MHTIKVGTDLVCKFRMIAEMKLNFVLNNEADLHWEDQGVGGWTILKWILER